MAGNFYKVTHTIRGPLDFGERRIFKPTYEYFCSTYDGECEERMRTAHGGYPLCYPPFGHTHTEVER